MATEESTDRAAVAQDLYIKGGASSASHRHAVNSTLGDFDMTEYLVDQLRLQPGKSVIDVGCGSGGHLVRFKQAVEPGGKAVGFDISADAAAAARAKGLDADVADAANLPVEDQTFDAVTCNFAIYYHPDVAAVLDEFHRIARPGARIVITGPGVGTNAELYDFHQQATGSGPSDADLMGIGFVQNAVLEAAQSKFGDAALEMKTNHITFPTPDAFLEYWRATSLFQRTPGADFEVGKRLLAGSTDPFVITKKIAAVSIGKG